MKSALIGHTGFVGSNLKEQKTFSDYYNSKNIDEMVGREFDLVVCAGVSAVKWMANKEPQADFQGIQRLWDVLKTIKVGTFILVSTIDVYPTLCNADEDYDCAALPNHAYGTHRRDLEQLCLNKFKKVHIVRLPGLFGMHLKKNIIFDLLHNNCIDKLNVNSSFQYYYLKNLWHDLEIVRAHDIPVINLFTEPLLTRELIDDFFPKFRKLNMQGNPLHYNLHTKYSHIFESTAERYVSSKQEVKIHLAEFLSSERALIK